MIPELIAIACVWVILMWRNHRIYKIRIKRIDQISADAKNSYSEVHCRLADMNRPGSTYLSMFFDITKWRYTDFYPEPIAETA